MEWLSFRSQLPGSTHIHEAVGGIHVYKATGSIHMKETVGSTSMYKATDSRHTNEVVGSTHMYKALGFRVFKSNYSNISFISRRSVLWTKAAVVQEETTDLLQLTIQLHYQSN